MSPDPRSFSRGKRGIAGNLVFSVFDRDALVEELRENKVYGWARMTPTHTYADSETVRDMAEWNAAMTEQAASGGGLSGIYGSGTDAVYVDEIPPFDVTITFANEYGQVAVMSIIGVEILNEGSGMSIDDIVTERAMTYVARQIKHIRPLPSVHG